MTKQRDEIALQKYKDYHRIYQRKYGKEHYNPEKKRKYYIYKCIAEVFRNILLD